MRDTAASPGTFEALRQIKPIRQVEAAELMVAVGNALPSYAKALLAGTPRALLAHPERPEKVDGRAILRVK